MIGTPLQLHALCSNLSSARATTRHGDSWPIQENVDHLLDLAPLWSGRTDELMTGVETLRWAALQNRRTHEAKHNDASLPALVEAFARTRGAWTDHCVFVAEHDAHHLGRIL